MAKNMFVSFLGKYSRELGVMSTVLRALGSRFLDHDEQRRVNEAVESFEAAARSIQESLPKVQEAMTVRVNAADVKKAVRELAPDLLATLVAEQVAKQLADREPATTPKEPE